MNDCFSQSYAEARIKFLGAAGQAAASVHTILNPHLGPGGEALAVDIASVGNPDAPDVLILVAGVHGVEGYYGSAVMIALLSGALSVPTGVRVVMVHGANPWGWAHGRRFTEENVDLNRNFWEPGEREFGDDAYRIVQPWVEIAALDDSAIARADAAGKAIAERIGLDNMKIALSAGQRCSPDGLFFAGHGSTWARLAMETIVAQALVKARRMFVLDLHTGLGPQGFADILIAEPADSAAAELIARYLGENARGTGRSAATGQKVGHSMLAGIQRMARRAGVDCLGAAVECGTLGLDTVLTALRLERALHVCGSNEHPRFAEIKKSLRDAFFVDTPQWKEMVLTQTFRHAAGAISLLGSDAGWPGPA